MRLLDSQRKGMPLNAGDYSCKCFPGWKGDNCQEAT